MNSSSSLSYKSSSSSSSNSSYNSNSNKKRQRYERKLVSEKKLNVVIPNETKLGDFSDELWIPFFDSIDFIIFACGGKIEKSKRFYQYDEKEADWSLSDYTKEYDALETKEAIVFYIDHEQNIIKLNSLDIEKKEKELTYLSSHNNTNTDISVIQMKQYFVYGHPLLYITDSSYMNNSDYWIEKYKRYTDDYNKRQFELEIKLEKNNKLDKNNENNDDVYERLMNELEEEYIKILFDNMPVECETRFYPKSHYLLNEDKKPVVYFLVDPEGVHDWSDVSTEILDITILENVYIVAEFYDDDTIQFRYGDEISCE